MSEPGFFEQQRNSPTGFALVVLLHAAVLGALVLIKSPGFIRPVDPPLVITPIRLPDDPPPVPPPDADRRPAQAPIRYDAPRPPIPLPTDGPTADSTPRPPFDTSRPGDVPAPPLRDDPPPAVRREAQIDPRYAGDLQPPYPAAEQRAQRGGTVRIRLTIGANGRVVSAQRLSATSDAFWRVTERQALSRWRFRPATLDGRPVEGVRVLTVHFRIEEY